LNYFLKNFYFYKSIKIEKFLISILQIGDIEKYLNRNRMIEIIIEVLFNISFITNKKHINLENTISNECLFELTEDNLKEKIILFCLNCLKSFINIFKTLINRKIVPEQNTKSQNNVNTKITGSNAVIPDSMSYMMMSRSEVNQNFNIKAIVTYIKNFLSLLSVYFISIPILTDKDKEKLKKYTDYANMFIEMVYEMKTIMKIKSSIITSILYFLIKTKTVFLRLGNETVVKAIFLLLCIGWPQYENDIFKYFSENFNVKLKKFHESSQQTIDKKLNSFDFTPFTSTSITQTVKMNEHKKEFICYLADLACWYYFEHFSSTKIVLKILSNVFRTKYGREKIFIDLIKWNIFSKSNRDNLKRNYRSQVTENSHTFLGKK
jgi:hypothetical protein